MRPAAASLARRGEASPAAVNAMRERNSEVIAPLLRAAAERGGGRPGSVDVELVSQSLVGAGEQVGRWWMEHPAVPKDEVAERFVRICAGAIAALGGAR